MKKKETLNVEIQRFKPNHSTGLTEEQVQSRKEQKLVNKNKAKSGKSYGQIIASNSISFFNILLYAVAAIYIAGMFIWQGDPNNELVISKLGFMVILLANILIGIFQEIKSKRAVDKLKLVDRQKSTVLRDGNEVLLYSDEIVLDDIVIFKAGDSITIDGPIIKGACSCNESMLTGEPNAVEKNIDDNVSSGTFLMSGQIFVRADKIGTETTAAQIQNKLKVIKKKKSKINRDINKIIKILSIIIFPIITSTIFSLLFMNSGGEHPSQLIARAGAALTSSLPIGLVLLTSVSLAGSALRLAKMNTLVRDINSVEGLSRIDTICLDKTGTITTGSLEVIDYSLLRVEATDELISEYIGALPIDNATSVALSKRFTPSTNFTVKESKSFTSALKYSSVTFDNFGSQVTYLLGAPDILIDGSKHKSVVNQIVEKTKQGFRVIVLVRKEEEVNIPLAFFVIQDAIRESAIETIEYFNENGVNVKIISGDNVETVKVIAKRSNVKNWERAISLENVADERIIDICEDYTIFARVTPEQKKLIVEALQNKRHNVAMTGDGINDIIAMQKSDCSISMSAGTDAAKQVADIVLVDNDFGKMKYVVKEGRRTINNITRVTSMFVMKSIFSILVQLLFILVPQLGGYPFTTEAFTLIGFAIAFLGMFYTFEGNYEKNDGNFLKNVMITAIPAGIFLTLSVLAATILGLTGFVTSENMVTIATLFFTIGGFIILFKTSSPFTKFRAIGYIITLVAIVALAVAMPNMFIVGNTPQISFTFGYLQELFSPIFNPKVANIFFNGTFSIKEWNAILIFILIGIPTYYIVYVLANKLRQNFKTKVLDED